jgi:hypothetical protein
LRLRRAGNEGSGENRRREEGSPHVRCSSPDRRRTSDTAPEFKAKLEESWRALARDDFSSRRHPALPLCSSMIFSENR